MKLLYVTWAPGEVDPKAVKLKRSWLPNLVGHDSFTLGRTIRTRLAVVSDNHIRHELTHTYQQKVGVLRFLWRYYLGGQRAAYEAAARAAETAAWPQWSYLA